MPAPSLMNNIAGGQYLIDVSGDILPHAVEGMCSVLKRLCRDQDTSLTATFSSKDEHAMYFALFTSPCFYRPC